MTPEERFERIETNLQSVTDNLKSVGDSMKSVGERLDNMAIRYELWHIEQQGIAQRHENALSALLDLHRENEERFKAHDRRMGLLERVAERL